MGFEIEGFHCINYNLLHTNDLKLLKQIEHDFDLIQLIVTNKCITRNSATCIDLLFSNVNQVLHRTQSVIMRRYD